MTADTPSLPAAQQCWGLFDASGKFKGSFLRRPFPNKISQWRAVGWTILPGRFVPDDAKEPNRD